MIKMVTTIDALPYDGKTLLMGEGFSVEEEIHAVMLEGLGKARRLEADDSEDPVEETASAGSYENRSETARPPGRQRQRQRKNQYDRRDLNTDSEV